MESREYEDASRNRDGTAKDFAGQILEDMELAYCVVRADPLRTGSSQMQGLSRGLLLSFPGCLIFFLPIDGFIRYRAMVRQPCLISLAKLFNFSMVFLSGFMYNGGINQVLVLKKVEKG